VRTWLWCGNLRERGYLEDLGLDGRIIVKLIFRKWEWGMDWLDLVQDRTDGGHS